MTRTHKLCSTVLGLGLLCGAAPMTLAQPAGEPPVKAANPEAPTAENRAQALAVVDRFVEAIGGAARLEEKRSSRMKGSISLMGQTGTLTVITIPGEMFVQKMSLPGLGLENLSGSDGTRGWTFDSMSGATLMPDAMHEQLRREADPSSILRYDEVYPVIEYLGDGEFEGAAVESIRVVDEAGLESVQHYAKGSALLIGGESDQDSPQGQIRVKSLASEYKDFGGLRVATVSTMEMGPMTMVMKIESIETEGVSATEIEIPKAVVKLLEKAAAKAAEETEKPENDGEG
ncbi:MAG: hypothetical protein ACI89L_002433 [Phycisphaerales bacterium]|jgi:hypothetical protein